MEEIKKVFGTNVQKFRKEHHWTQAELAEKIDISDAFMAHIERGSRGVSMETIELLARCFEVPYSALFEETFNSNKNFKSTFFSLEAELKEKSAKLIEECILNAKNNL